MLQSKCQPDTLPVLAPNLTHHNSTLGSRESWVFHRRLYLQDMHSLQGMVSRHQWNNLQLLRTCPLDKVFRMEAQCQQRRCFRMGIKSLLWLVCTQATVGRKWNPHSSNRLRMFFMLKNYTCQQDMVWGRTSSRRSSSLPDSLCNLQDL